MNVHIMTPPVCTTLEPSQRRVTTGGVSPGRYSGPIRRNSFRTRTSVRRIISAVTRSRRRNKRGATGDWGGVRRNGTIARCSSAVSSTTKRNIISRVYLLIQCKQVKLFHYLIRLSSRVFAPETNIYIYIYTLIYMHYS